MMMENNKTEQGRKLPTVNCPLSIGQKIINDPVYGFVTVPAGLLFEIVRHPFLQRLRHIKQVSMTHLVYPGALHTRFQHVIGAMHLMSLAIGTLRGKGTAISPAEEEAALAAILLHDIGHGPFSHSLEHTLVEGVSHEMVSAMLMDRLDAEFGGKLELAIRIFRDDHPRKFFHQLVSGQLDTDRMDYLKRDSFFTGVSEGVISSDRIIKMLCVRGDRLLVEAKGIYSVEKFLIARRLMYWQVYLHKTVVGAEQMLIKILRRAKMLSARGEKLFATRALRHFLENRINAANFTDDPQHLFWFTQLDDSDIMSAVKEWAHAEDRVLATLCQRLLRRDLPRTELRNKPFTETEIAEVRKKTRTHFGLAEDEVDYFVYTQRVRNSAYDIRHNSIGILDKSGRVRDIAEASDLSNLETLTKTVEKHALSYPKEIG